MAELPVDAPCWRSSDEEEHFYTESAKWVVINQKIGVGRLRRICKVIKDVAVYPPGLRLQKEGEVKEEYEHEKT